MSSTRSFSNSAAKSSCDEVITSCVMANESYTDTRSNKDSFFDVGATSIVREARESFEEGLVPEMQTDDSDEKADVSFVSSKIPSYNSEDDDICGDSLVVVPSNARKNLQKCATFPSSEAEKENFVSDGVNKKKSTRNQCSLSTTINQCHLSNLSSYERSISLPATLKLVPAIKGSRERIGASLPEKMHVKWAPDVYDPPVTSTSHTVNNHQQQRSKPKRKERKKKQKRKTFSGDSCKNKVNKHREADTAVPTVLELQSADPGAETTPSLGTHAKQIEGNLDYGVNQETMCRGSIVMEAAARMHFSVAEAS